VPHSLMREFVRAQVRHVKPWPVNFSRSLSANYAQIQDEIGGAVFRHLPEDSVSFSDREYREGAVNFTLFIRDHADVLMSHGLADKRYFWRREEDSRDRMVNRFQHVFVPGDWLRDRLLDTKDVRLRPSQVHINGWPRLDLLVARQAEFDRSDVPQDQRRARVLWAPTHDYRKRGPDSASTSSFPEFEGHLPALREHFDVQVSLHPRNRTDKRPTGEQLLWADYVISDFGTMVYEAWALGKPVLFPFWIMGERIIRHLKQSAEAEIFQQRIGHHADSIEEMVAILGAGPVVEDDVTAFMDGYLDPKYLGCSGQRTANLLRDICRGRKPR
jgi:hypothetical protein